MRWLAPHRMLLNRLGEIRDRSFQQRCYRTNGHNLVTTTVVLWSVIYLERAASALHKHGRTVYDGLPHYLPSLDWEHSDLNGDYLSHSNGMIGAGKIKTRRPRKPA